VTGTSLSVWLVGPSVGFRSSAVYVLRKTLYWTAIVLFIGLAMFGIAIPLKLPDPPGRANFKQEQIYIRRGG
jgi:hypothetical protein